MNNAFSKNQKIVIVFLTFFLGAALLTHNILGILNNCFHATDLAIYQQAIYNIAAGISWNPFLSIRNIKIFNDHFDPILIIASPIARLFNYHPVSLIIFEWSFYFAIFIFLYRDYRKNRISQDWFYFTILIWTFSKGILVGLLYPIHPTVWTVVPTFLLIRSIYFKNDRDIILWGAILCLFKEVFPFGILGLGLYKLLIKNKKVGLWCVSISLLFIVFAFFIRPMLFGSLFSYKKVYTKNEASLVIRLYKMVRYFQYDVIIKDFLPYFFLLSFVPIAHYKKSESLKSFAQRFFESSEMAVLSFLTPLFLLHAIPNILYLHRESTFIAALFASLVYSNAKHFILVNKKIMLIGLLAFIVSVSGQYTKIFKLLVLKQTKKCLINDTKTSELKVVMDKVKEIELGKTIMATGGLVPRILRPGMEIFQAKMYNAYQFQYDYFILERNGSGDTFPFTKEQIETVVKTCEKDGPEKIFSGNYFYFVKGPFTQRCLKDLIELPGENHIKRDK